MPESFDVLILIIGAGRGGARPGIAMRQRKFTSSIAIVGEERDTYERPRLSKD